MHVKFEVKNQLGRADLRYLISIDQLTVAVFGAIVHRQQFHYLSVRKLSLSRVVPQMALNTTKINRVEDLK